MYELGTHAFHLGTKKPQGAQGFQSGYPYAPWGYEAQSDQALDTLND